MEGRAVEVDVVEFEEGPEERGLPAYLAEFIGTFLLVLFICMVIAVASGLRVNDFAVIGLVHFLVLAMLVYTLGGTSGAHFNPAVTMTLAGLRKISGVDAAIYILLQLAGAVAAALVCKALLLDEGAAVNYGAATVSDFLSGRALAGLSCEVIGTFVLMWAIMGTAVNPRGEANFAGLVIGGTLGFAVMVFASLDGASFNPARWFGPALVSGTWTDAWVYIVGPIIGALLAGFVYRTIVIDPQAREGEAPIDTLPG
jgi:glycerol uptake facilitator protein